MFFADIDLISFREKYFMQDVTFLVKAPVMKYEGQPSSFTVNF